MYSKSLYAALALYLLFICACSPARPARGPLEVLNGEGKERDTLLEGLLTRRMAGFDTVLSNSGRYAIQIIYTQIDRKEDGQPEFRHHFYRVDPSVYFYPASTVKMPVAFLALHRLNELNQPGLDKHSTMVTDSSGPGQSAVYVDPSAGDGRATIAHYIRKVFLVSDNDAYNRLYEFLGQDYINTTLRRMGYDSVQIIHRLSLPLNEEQNRHTNAIRFYDTAARVVYRQPAVRSSLVVKPREVRMGMGFLSRGKLVEQPFDFTLKNRLSLADLHTMLQSVIFPESVPEKQRFHLTPDDYRFLYSCMSMYPRESTFPQYDSTHSDAYVKFLLYGGEGRITDTSIRIFNKVGDAYGFLTDAAYVVDFHRGVEFLLSATIYCNSDGIFNDDRYDYQTIGFPFLKALGQAIYHHELQRPRKHRPELGRFRVGD